MKKILVIVMRNAFPVKTRKVKKDTALSQTYLVFHIEYQQVAEGLGRERVLLQEELELLEALRGVVVHVHEGLVVQRDGI